jgi:anti-sigma regulatory factor (Ser/Thr protein kinase)
MPADLDLTVPATTRGLRTALEAIDRVCAARQAGADVTARTRIVVEELFTNTIKYGYGGESERPVRVAVHVTHEITVTIEDEAPHFDPTNWRAPSASPGDRPPGQAGIPLVMGFAKAASHRTLSATGGNCVTIVIA